MNNDEPTKQLDLSQLWEKFADFRIPHKKETTVAKELEKIEVADREQDVKLKKISAWFIFSMLAAETLALFTILFFDGFRLGGFHIEDNTLKIVATCTIAQVAYMVKIIISYLFSSK